MGRPEPTAPRTRSRRRGPTAIGLAVVAVATIVLVIAPSASSSARSFAAGILGGGGATSEDDGALPSGVTVFDTEHPGITNLDPDLLRAVRRAASDAAAGGTAFSVNSGWRSAAHQEQLLREAIAEHGSEAEALRWVATPDTSAHVAGDAVDIGPADAWSWLAQHGSRYGLCPVYGNEPWHFELRPDAIDHGCPTVYPDPTHDPRLQSH